jgi:integrase
VAIHRLSAGAVEGEIKRKVKTPKMLHDGGGLYLQVARSGSVSWIFRFKSPVTGKSRDMGLGPVHKLSLAKARDEAKRLREMIHGERKDPIDERAKASKNGVSFRQHFEHMESLEPHYRWREMFDLHAFPVIGDKRVDAITTDDITGILAKLINSGKHETARKLQQRVQAVIRSARGSIDTPAHKIYITHTLRSFKRVRKNKPYPSLDFAKVPALMRDLQGRTEIAAHALAFVILTACRTGDINGIRKKGEAKPPLRWQHIDWKRRVWTVPAVKTSDDTAPEAFEVPLSDAALSVLRRVQAMKLPSEMVFPCCQQYMAHRYTQPLSMSAMRRQVQLTHPGVTVHGFRTAFKTWASETTNIQNDVIETALAHRIFSKDKAEGAYKSKTTFFEKRRALMARWGEFVTGKSKVVALKVA